MVVVQSRDQLVPCLLLDLTWWHTLRCYLSHSLVCPVSSAHVVPINLLAAGCMQEHGGVAGL